MDFIPKDNKLNLGYNKITEIKGLTNLVSLQQLDFWDNQITEIKGLNNLVNLQKLSLSVNYIIEITGLTNLTSLKELYLNSNQLLTLRPEIGKLTNLKVLGLNNNLISKPEQEEIKKRRSFFAARIARRRHFRGRSPTAR
jgi:Leucine-rich repeat (LRR) protein